MVSVSDVHSRDLCREEFDEAVDGGFVVDGPEAVSEAVFLGDEVIDRFLVAYDVVNDSVNLVHCRVCEEHRLHVGVGDSDVFHAVFFLVLTCQLMFFDDLVDVVLAPSACYNTILPVGVFLGRVHALSVDIKFLFFILDEPSVIFE